MADIVVEVQIVQKLVKEFMESGLTPTAAFRKAKHVVADICEVEWSRIRCCPNTGSVFLSNDDKGS